MVALGDPALRARLSPGAVLGGRFRLEAPLGRGGYGEVWRAAELLPDGSEVRQVALKLLGPELAGVDWGREARALGSVRHPALVTVYSAGLLELPPPLPFVAMELLEGETLAHRLRERGPMPWRRALGHIVAIAGALDVIHAQGILHLDVKPSNLLLGPDGRPRLIDFGVARHRGATTLPPPAASTAALDTAAVLALPVEGSSRPAPGAPVVGTAGFLAPEVLEGHAPTPAADAYALGACLFQLLTGRLPQRAPPPPSEPAQLEAWRSRLWASTLTSDLLDLRELAPGTPAGVVALVTALLALDPARRPDGLEATCRGCWQRPYGTPDPPYLGLRAYGPSAEGLLFGRDDDSERLAAELSVRPMLALQGASGSGKSSLAMAGVVPALARAFVDDRDDWVAVTVRPGHDLDQALAEAHDRHGANVGLVLVVDQLEEAITQLGSEEKARFVLSLGQHAAGAGGGQPRPGLRVLCTLREDYTTRLAALGALGELLERAVRFVAPPSVASGRAIVLEPARLAGVAVDDERPVVDDVLKELRSDEVRLPLVAFALGDWWAARRGGVLPAEAWARIGGVSGALSRHADATLDALPPPARLAARDLCLRLVHFDLALARDRVPEGELRSFGPDHAQALDAFLGARLVSVDDGRVSFSHEALLRDWSTLAGWIADERTQRSEAASLGAASRRWREAPAPARPHRLLGGVDLARALDLAHARPDLTAPISDFIDASRRQVRRDRWLRGGAATLLLAAAAAVALGYGWQLRRHTHDIGLREADLARLADHLRTEEQAQRQLQESLDGRSRELDAERREADLCHASLTRVEQEHRASLAARFPPDSFDHRVVTFLLQFEYIWNLHDADRLASFFTPEAEWQGFRGTREQVARSIAETWRKSPHARWLLAEASVSHAGSGDETHVRLTREERAQGVVQVAVLQLTLRGERPDRLAIAEASVEKIIARRSLGCP